MLDYHKAKGADVTIACMPVPWAEASRFGVVIADDNGNIKDFEEKPLEAEQQSCVYGDLYL